MLGSRLMRSRLCVAPGAVGFGAGLALPRCGASFFVWCELTAALGGHGLELSKSTIPNMYADDTCVNIASENLNEVLTDLKQIWYQ